MKPYKCSDIFKKLVRHRKARTLLHNYSACTWRRACHPEKVLFVFVRLINKLFMFELRYLLLQKMESAEEPKVMLKKVSDPAHVLKRYYSILLVRQEDVFQILSLGRKNRAESHAAQRHSRSTNTHINQETTALFFSKV